MSELRQITQAAELVYGKIMDITGERLIPVLAVDSAALATDGLAAFRMQAFANEAAVEKTFETGKATFYSRTRQGLWTKGEESGNLLIVRAAFTDCDFDSLLLDVDPQGPTCHTGASSCFETNPIGE